MQSFFGTRPSPSAAPVEEPSPTAAPVEEPSPPAAAVEEAGPPAAAGEKAVMATPVAVVGSGADSAAVGGDPAMLQEGFANADKLSAVPGPGATMPTSDTPPAVLGPSASRALAGLCAPSGTDDTATMPADLNKLLSDIMANKPAKSTEPVGTPDEGSDEKLFKDGAAGFDLRCPLGWRFTREMGKDTAYKKLGRTEKAAFRAEWADTKYNEIVKEKSFTKEYKHVDLSKGTYRSVWWVLKDTGYPLNPEAESQTMAYVKKCHTLGAPWVSYDQMFERVDVLVMENGFQETFSKAWALKTTSLESPQSSSAPSASSGSGAAPPAVAAQVNVGKRNKGTLGAKEAATALPSPKEKNSKEAKEETSLQRAMKTKGIFTSTMANLTNILRNIESNVEWSWAANCPLVVEAKSCQAEIERLLLANQTANDFFVWKLSDIKKRSNFNLESCTTNIPGIFDPALIKLTKQCEKLLNMHKGTLA
jgi:hypothetical protein